MTEIVKTKTETIKLPIVSAAIVSAKPTDSPKSATEVQEDLYPKISDPVAVEIKLPNVPNVLDVKDAPILTITKKHTNAKYEFNGSILKLFILDREFDFRHEGTLKIISGIEFKIPKDYIGIVNCNFPGSFIQPAFVRGTVLSDKFIMTNVFGISSLFGGGMKNVEKMPFAEICMMKPEKMTICEL